MQHVDEQRVRDARHIVMTEIHRHEEEGKNWWGSDERLQRAAEQLCASYDHLGGIIKFDGPDRVGQYFLEREKPSIVVLKGLLLVMADNIPSHRSSHSGIE